MDDLSVSATISVRKSLPTVVHAGVKQLAVSKDGRKLLIGTAGGDIAELVASDGR